MTVPNSLRWRVGIASCAIAYACVAQAQAPTAAPTLREAVDAAWALNPANRAQDNRRAELDARDRAASSLTAGPPSLTLAHRTDRLNTNGGLRENEAELAVPLWTGGVRSATATQVAADRASLGRQQSLARLKLAGEVREVGSLAALAGVERDTAMRKLDEGRTLAADVDRRLRAGDVARIDALQAQLAVRQAQAALEQAQLSVAKLRTQWLALTGLTTMPPSGGWGETPQPGAESAPAPGDEHPAIAAAQAQVKAASARLALADADRRDPMELSLAAIRDRSAAGATPETSLRIALKIPFGGDSRNASRIAAARADLDAAQAEADAMLRQTRAEAAAAQVELATARSGERNATERAALSAEAQSLIAKSYRLGESDLPTRLRADNEKFDAELALARARAETQRAVSRLHQALGFLP